MLKARQRAVLDALLPELGTRFDAFYAGFQSAAPAPMRLAFLAACELAFFVSPLLIGRLPPLTRLSAADRERALAALGKSRFYLLRQQLLVLKTVAALDYGARPEVRRALGMPQ